MTVRLALAAALAVLLACATTARATPGITVYLNNATSEISRAQLDNQLPAIQQAVHDFAAYWHIDATVTDTNPRPGDWVVNLTDAQAPCALFGGCVLGYHWRKGGFFYAEIYVAETLADGFAVSNVETHEIFEMLADPYGDSSSHTRGGFSLQEVCDPVSGWSYWLPAADGTPVQVADFVTRAWFAGGPGPYDHNWKLKRAGQIAPGGYSAHWDGRWVETYG